VLSFLALLRLFLQEGVRDFITSEVAASTAPVPLQMQTRQAFSHNGTSVSGNARSPTVSSFHKPREHSSSISVAVDGKSSAAYNVKASSATPAPRSSSVIPAAAGRHSEELRSSPHAAGSRVGTLGGEQQKQPVGGCCHGSMSAVDQG